MAVKIVHATDNPYASADAPRTTSADRDDFLDVDGPSSAGIELPGESPDFGYDSKDGPVALAQSAAQHIPMLRLASGAGIASALRSGENVVFAEQRFRAG